MKTTVQVSWLLERMRENRSKHREIFLEALEGYREKAIQAFEAQLARVRAGKPFTVHIGLTQPVDMTKEYNRAIAMMESNKLDRIELSEQEFAQYVMDEWGWKHNFLATNSMYSAKAAAELPGDDDE